ncbi:class I SAM-dependent methyltransferase [Ancylomarina sp.]|uniref:class I SAM-dependent methyltransferase n=1 Tax=Ancylomarina sp. TaxID=1970196 RepID=UPI003569069F
MGKCPLCRSENTSFYYEGESREYYSCIDCGLVFVPQVFFITYEAEKVKYDQHENFPDDLVYQDYLKQIMNPVLDRISEGASGLDFGSGPGPTLSKMFESRGFQTDIYDAYFAPNEEVFNKSYDFITACEVVEHLHKPQMELDRLFGLLKPNGVLAIKTQILSSKEEFPTWYYKRDMTHVCFFSDQSMRFLADKWKVEMVSVKSNVVLFIKTSKKV